MFTLCVFGPWEETIYIYIYHSIAVCESAVAMSETGQRTRAETRYNVIMNLDINAGPMPGPQGLTKGQKNWQWWSFNP